MNLGLLYVLALVQRIVGLLLATAGLLALAAVPALAATDPDPGDAVPGLPLWPLVALVLPMLVALVRDRYSSTPWGTWLLFGLSAASAVLLEISDPGAVIWRDVLIRWATLFILAVGAHYGLLRPAGITGRQGLIASAVPGGLGAPKAGEPVTAGTYTPAGERTAYEAEHERPDADGAPPPLV